MFQSQIINVLPRRVVASLWASQETRVSLLHLSSIARTSKRATPAATSPSFLCTELPVRYTHVLRLLSALSPDALQSPIVRNVAHRYLHDICTLIHPSLLGTSPKAFGDVVRRLRQRQAASLIRLRYALLATPSPPSIALLENVNTIGLGIHFLLDQHLSWATQDQNHAQSVCAHDIAQQAIHDARQTLGECFGKETPDIRVLANKTDDLKLVHVPSIIHRVLYESSLLALRARMTHDQETLRPKNWLQRRWHAYTQSEPLTLNVFGGPTSVGFRLNSNVPLVTNDLAHAIPRDANGIPTCAGLLRNTKATTIDDDHQSDLESEALSGWRAAKAMASHWGGNLDAVSVDGLGSTVYLALDRDTSLVERYPSRHALAASSTVLLRHHRRSSVAAAGSASPLTLQTAAAQLDAFLYAIADPSQQPMYHPNPQYYHHSVSLSAAVGHA